MSPSVAVKCSQIDIVLVGSEASRRVLEVVQYKCAHDHPYIRHCHGQVLGKSYTNPGFGRPQLICKFRHLSHGSRSPRPKSDSGSPWEAIKARCCAIDGTHSGFYALQGHKGWCRSVEVLTLVYIAIYPPCVQHLSTLHTTRWRACLVP